MTISRWAGPLLVLSLPLALLACSDDEGGGDREPNGVEESIIDQLVEPESEAVDPEAVEADRAVFVAECMAEGGFEYLAPPPERPLFTDLGLTEEQFRAQYGFGHSTVIDLMMASQARSDEAAAEQGAALDAMSDAERTQYLEAERDCIEQSYAEFGFPDTGTVSLSGDSPIADYIEQASEAAANDPRVAEVTDAWSQCMGGQGYDFADRDDMGLPLEAEAEPFITAYQNQGQALVDAGRGWTELRVADVLDATQLAELQELQQRELAVAAAHQHCLDQGHDIDAVYSEVYDEHLAEAAG